MKQTNYSRIVSHLVDQNFWCSSEFSLVADSQLQAIMIVCALKRVSHQFVDFYFFTTEGFKCGTRVQFVNFSQQYFGQDLCLGYLNWQRLDPDL